MTAAPATTRALATCQACGGPCATYKGSVWQWTCAGCIRRHLDASAAKAVVRDEKARAKLLARRNDQLDARTTPPAVDP